MLTTLKDRGANDFMFHWSSFWGNNIRDFVNSINPFQLSSASVPSDPYSPSIVIPSLSRDSDGGLSFYTVFDSLNLNRVHV